MRRLSAVFLAVTLLIPTIPVRAQEEPAFDPDFLLADTELTGTAGFSRDDLARLFSRGFLGTYKTVDAQGILRAATDIVWNASLAFDVNPKVLAVLLQREQSLVEDDRPSQDQLDWAMGYAVCDSCGKNDPMIQKYRGFGPQVYYAAKRIRESYLDDLAGRGTTLSGYGVGLPAVVDGVSVTPQSLATAVLYTYTPHLHGNQNFVRIWNRWFVPTYPNGTLLESLEDGTRWLMQNGRRRPVLSRAALFSRVGNRPAVFVTAEALQTFAEGPALQFPNYTLVRTPDQTVYLLVDDLKRPFASLQAVRKFGYAEDDIVDVEADDLAGYADGTALSVSAPDPNLRLLQDKKTGGVYAVRDGVKRPVISRGILKAAFGALSITPVARTVLDALPTGTPALFPDGTLVMKDGGKDVYVIDGGKRRHVVDERAFLAYGWRWNDVVKTDAKSLDLHPLGDPLTAPEDREAPILDLVSASL